MSFGWMAPSYVWCAALWIVDLIGPYGVHPAPVLSHCVNSSAMRFPFATALIIPMAESALIFSRSVGNRVIACSRGIGVVGKALRYVRIYSLYAVVRGRRISLECISAPRNGV